MDINGGNMAKKSQEITLLQELTSNALLLQAALSRRR
jgi:hypothetical protein